MIARAAPLLLLAALAGCATDPRDIGREPHMSPVGSGLASIDDQLPTGAIRDGALGPHMRLDENRINLYRDVRAMNVGDVVTVNISMDDKAVLGNSTDRSRDSKIKSEWSFLFDFLAGGTGGAHHKWDGSITNDLQSSSSTQGQGSINRSEQIRLSIAAVVTAVLPNGNLVIRGSQEIRVNYEMRVLTIAGIARPRDIAKDNTISYDKIAEARVSYGGRGRLSEVQQPAWGQQAYDIFAPF
ncbi:flagellar basal body L-ring protein FlgH [Methylosinus sp. Sm6]|uniref:flagellar basal body L-ring protein FlgH n=1 Tax=Methylosinus sp. Sm6 TaxID=2866948 RepID=UPI001C99C3DD|nr:flagellar basal body L-ring protein FlgH [Methylosinus sp. Sm6]MBY6240598.1 flagellar basal body L-ring protein FlgH [Methylosinus sp. Sm6]